MDLVSQQLGLDPFVCLQRTAVQVSMQIFFELAYTAKSLQQNSHFSEELLILTRN